MWIIFSYVIGMGLPKRARRWRSVVLAVVVVAALMVALALGVHWLPVALMAAFIIAWNGMVAGFRIAVSFIERAIWPRGVASVDHRNEPTFLLDDHELGVTTDEQTRMGELARRRRIAPRRRFYVFLLTGLIVPLGSVAAFMLLNLPSAVEWSIAGLALVPMMFIMRPMKAERVQWHGRLLVAIGRCPSCGYDLLNLPVADDGCSVCPECGAAWRVPPDDQVPDASEPTV